MFYSGAAKKAESIKNYKLSDILQHLKRGGRAHICTHLKAWKIEQKNIDQWEKSGYKLLKEENGSLYMARGKRFDCIDFCYIVLD